MNKYFKDFVNRGLVFAGFGPIVMAIVYFVLSKTMDDFSLTGEQIFLAVISTYLLAFVQAGASVFNQIEHWPVAKSLLCHFSLLYVAYSLCYVVNTWIPFEPMVLLIFTLVFTVSYFLIWVIVYLCVRHTKKQLNSRL